MRFVLATEKLVVQGRAFVGFPLLLARGKPVEPAQTFLWELLTRSGRRQSRLTWEKYGRTLFDFFSFCEVNSIDWRGPAPRGMPSALEWYRDWSKGEVKNSSRTINQRLRLIVKFYEWAYKHGHVTTLPVEYAEIHSSRDRGMLAHVADSRSRSPDVLLPERALFPQFLSKEQVRACLRSLTNQTHHLMFALMVRTGLRQIECRTFPLKYVFDPSRRKDLTEGQFIRVRLSPRDMKLKLDKPRTIDMPYSLMEDLWWYAIRHRTKRMRREEVSATSLFIAEHGRIYGDQSLTDIFSRLQKRVGFRVRPHMLRHTYATYTLMSLRRTQYQGDPLLYVRDRMGHASVTSTSVYLHVINQLVSELMLRHEEEIDSLFEAQE